MTQTTTPTLKTGIIGLGPVGLILAVHLKNAGCEVVLCDIDTMKLDLIRSQGVITDNAIEKKAQFEHLIPSIAELKDFDLDVLFLCTKVYQMKGLMKQISALKTGKLRVVSAQNGIDSEKIPEEVFGKEKTLRMVINYAGILRAPNVANVTFFNPPNYIAHLCEVDEDYATLIAAMLTNESLETQRVDTPTIHKKIWEKAILNSALSSLCALTRLTMAEAVEAPETREIIKATIMEALDVTNALDLDLGDDFLDQAFAYLNKGGNHFPSLAVDFINHRPTEIAYFNGKIAEYGKKTNVLTPINLSITNMLVAVENKYEKLSQFPIPDIDKIRNETKTTRQEPCFLGIDSGSAYTKLTLLNSKREILYQTTLSSLTRGQSSPDHVIETLRSEFQIISTCITGYGRKHMVEADVVKTEILCAAVGANEFRKGAKNIVDIGGEDVKVIRCDKKGLVENFYMNDKCAAGTGTFITEIAEKVKINLPEMSELASNSEFMKELNSVCTVFAKTEIMQWMLNGMPVKDVARGIYLSIVNRVSKIRINTDLPIYLIGGVIAHHPYLQTLLSEKYGVEVHVIPGPQHIVSLGAAHIAANDYERKKVAVASGDPQSMNQQ